MKSLCVLIKEYLRVIKKIELKESATKVSGKKSKHTLLQPKDNMKLRCNISQILDRKERIMIHDIVYISTGGSQI